MAREDDWARAVRKLVALTESGEISWSRFSQLASKRENVQGDAFQTVVKGRLIGVYLYRFKSYEDEENWSWENEVAVEFVTGDGELQWRWPATAYRWELIEAVRGQVVGAPDFLRSFLAEETTS